MGCLPSSLNRIDTEHLFHSNDILYLRQSWNTIKSHDFRKLTQTILIKTANQSRSFRLFCISNIEVDGNNYDYGQHDSCLRTDLSWQVGLPDYSNKVISFFDKLLTLLDNETRAKTQIASLHVTEADVPVDYDTLLIMKQCILEMLRERLKTTDYSFTDEHEQAWNNLLTFIIERILKRVSDGKGSTVTVISSVTNNQRC